MRQRCKSIFKLHLKFQYLIITSARHNNTITSLYSQNLRKIKQKKKHSKLIIIFLTVIPIQTITSNCWAQASLYMWGKSQSLIHHAAALSVGGISFLPRATIANRDVITTGTDFLTCSPTRHGGANITDRQAERGRIFLQIQSIPNCRCVSAYAVGAM